MKSMIFMCLSLVIVVGIARVYMAGGLDGLLGDGPGSVSFGGGALKNVKSVTTDKDVVVYKWRDEKGVMHFGGMPPDSSGRAEKIELKANQNIIRATKIIQLEPVKETGDGQDNGGNLPGIDNLYSPEGVSQIITQAKELKEALNKQQEDREKMLETLMKK